MSDLALLLWIAGVGSIVVPALICAFCGPVENSSRAIKNDPRKFADVDCIGGAGLRWIDEQDGRVPSGPGSISLRSTEPLRVSSAFGGHDPIARGGE